MWLVRRAAFCWFTDGGLYSFQPKYPNHQRSPLPQKRPPTPHSNQPHPSKSVQFQSHEIQQGPPSDSEEGRHSPLSAPQSPVTAYQPADQLEITHSEPPTNLQDDPSSSGGEDSGNSGDDLLPPLSASPPGTARRLPLPTHDPGVTQGHEGNEVEDGGYLPPMSCTPPNSADAGRAPPGRTPRYTNDSGYSDVEEQEHRQRLEEQARSVVVILFRNKVLLFKRMGISGFGT